MPQSENRPMKSVEQLEAELAEAEGIAQRVREQLEQARWVREFDGGADATNWFPVRHVWPEVTDGRAWQGTSVRALATVRISPSADHPGFFDYSITNMANGEIVETRRPAAAHALLSFLEQEGVDPRRLTWIAQEVAGA